MTCAASPSSGRPIASWGAPQEAEDAVQETLLKLYQSISRFRSGARFSTFLFEILDNTCIDMPRKRKPQAASVEADRLPAELSHELRPSLAEAVKSLPLKMKSCFVLFAIEQYSHEEAAAMLGVNPGTVKVNVYRARKKLRAGPPAFYIISIFKAAQPKSKFPWNLDARIIKELRPKERNKQQHIIHNNNKPTRHPGLKPGVFARLILSGAMTPI